MKPAAGLVIVLAVLLGAKDNGCGTTPSTCGIAADCASRDGCTAECVPTSDGNAECLYSGAAACTAP